MSKAPGVTRAREAWQLRNATTANLISTLKELRPANPILSGRGAAYKSSGRLEHASHLLPYSSVLVSVPGRPFTSGWGNHS